MGNAMKKYGLHLAIPLLLSLSCIAAGIALAQAPGVPNPYAIASPTGAEQVNVDNTGPYIATVTVTELRDAAGYVKLVPTTGTTYTPATNISVIQASPAGTLAAWTVKTPASPVDGQRLQIFSTQIITSMTVSASAGQTVNGGAVSASFAAANGNVEFIYSASNTTWDRIQ
jgi:hypothetical protein